METQDLGFDITVTSWQCPCHPLARWGYYSMYEGCHISDLNYAGSPTYSVGYPTLRELWKAHPGARPTGMDLSADDRTKIIEMLIKDRLYRTPGGEMIEPS